MAGVKWTAVKGAPGVYRRVDEQGRERWRAVAWAADADKPGRRKQITETFDRLTDARRWRSDYTGTTPKRAPSKSQRTLQAAYDALHDGTEYAPATVKLHDDLWDALRKVDRTILTKKLHEVDTLTLRKVLKKIDAPSMRDKARQLVGLIYRHEDFTPSPAVKEYKPRVRASRMNGEQVQGRYLEDGAVERLIAEMPERYRFLVRFLWRVGLRPGEAFALTVGQFDPDEERLRIDRAVNGGVVGPTKTGRSRYPFLPSSIAAALTEHIRNCPGFFDPDALVFTTERGSMIDLHNWRQRHWGPAAKRAGLVGAKPYDLRHSACSNAIAAGIDVVTISEMTGHSVEVLLRTYAHYVEEAGRKAAERLNEAFALA